MYLDTKNLAASSGSNNKNNTTVTTTAASAPTAKRRLRKVWQPLRRLLAVGGKGRPLPHPNNVDLNNTQQQLRLAELDTSGDSKSLEESSKSEDSLSLPELITPPNTPTLISSVYVEKASPRGCGACQHGRNCQHAHPNSESSQLQSSPQPPTLADLHVMEALNLPLQYISTDNGTFFWANTQERVDDDLLHAWLCQSFSQLPGTLC